MWGSQDFHCRQGGQALSEISSGFEATARHFGLPGQSQVVLCLGPHAVMGLLVRWLSRGRMLSWHVLNKKLHLGMFPPRVFWIFACFES